MEGSPKKEDPYAFKQQVRFKSEKKKKKFPIKDRKKAKEKKKFLTNDWKTAREKKSRSRIGRKQKKNKQKDRWTIQFLFVPASFSCHAKPKKKEKGKGQNSLS